MSYIIIWDQTRAVRKESLTTVVFHWRGTSLISEIGLKLKISKTLIYLSMTARGLKQNIATDIRKRAKVDFAKSI